jgi:hypothetical protein
MRGFSHGYVSSLLLVCFLLLGIAMVCEKEEEAENGFEPR